MRRAIVAATLAIIAVITWTIGLSAIIKGPRPYAGGMTAFDFAFTAIDGSPMKLEPWRGKVLLVVNTASFCGFTPQYEGLQALWTLYEKRGLVVIGVPSNDFHQESEDHAEIVKLCKGAYGVTFPLTTREHVIGDGAHPFYRWARDMFGEHAVPRWNFHKLLIGRDGKVAQSYASSVTPDDAELVGALEAELARDAGAAG